MTDTSDKAIEVLRSDVMSQVGDDVQKMFSHEALFKRTSAMLLALQAERKAGWAAKVKPLVWKVQSATCQIADTPWGCVAVQDESHALAPKRWGWWVVGSGEDDCPTGYGTNIEEAKSAAQADYTARILAALTPDTEAKPCHT